MTRELENKTRESVLSFDHPTPGYACPLAANTIGLRFDRLEIRDDDSGEVVLKIPRQSHIPPATSAGTHCGDDSCIRAVRYSFPDRFLKFKTVRMLLDFSVSGKAVKSLKMIERHYFKGKLLRSYSFDFGSCAPASENSWEGVYEMPQHSEEEIAEFVEFPHSHTSDSFYFADGELVLHNKASFAYQATGGGQAAQEAPGGAAGNKGQSDRAVSQDACFVGE